jgi:hypothetical protein
MLHFLTIAALVLAGGQTAPPQDPASELMLQIGLHTLRSDGRQQAFAGNHGSDLFESYVWGNEALCWLSASGREPSTVPVIGWHMRGRVLKRTADDFLVDIEWRRLWERSTRLTDGPKGSMQVTLKAGDRLLLDEVVPAGASPCQVASGRLEAAIVSVPQSRPVFRAGAAGDSATGSGVGGAGGGRGGGGASTASGAGSVGAGPASTGAGGRGANRREATAEVWLVHKPPSGAEAVQRIAFAFGSSPGEFEFPPVAIAKDGDQASIVVRGRLRLMGPAGQEKLMVSLDRTIRKEREFNGGSIKMLDPPSPDDVLSFELPLLPTETDGSLRALLAGHQFSVRLRVKTSGFVLQEP